MLLLERYISNFTRARYYFLCVEFSDFLCQPISRWTNYINFSTSLFINFFVYILQIIQKLNHKHEFYVQSQIPIPLDNMQPKILTIPASC
jgi:hypothetical protein